MIRDKKILVTGGHGFLGSMVCESLVRRGFTLCDGKDFAPNRVFTFSSKQCNLENQEETFRLVEKMRPDVIIHLAARVGGIGINQKKPGSFFYSNIMMGVNVIEAARRFGVSKMVTVGTICAYPKFTPVPFREEDLWSGYPEETNAPYGLAKKALLVQSQAYRAEFGLNAIYLLPVNLYGPKDNFDPESSHVIPAMIRKFIEARDRGHAKVTLWGTGSASREFLFVKDAGEGIVMAAEHYNDREPVNLGSGMEISIRDLAIKIGELTGFKGELEWDRTKPDGQPRRCLNVDRAKAFGFSAQTSFEAGLRETIAWYEGLRNMDS